jgi:hypothetical protein
MPEYTLKTEFTQEDLNRFYATGSNVVVAKPNAGGAPNVAWVVYRPLLDNTMTWDEVYGIYASNADIVNGALLTQMSQTGIPASDGKVYPLTPAGYFGPPSSGGTPGSYTVKNEYDNLPKGYITIGLYQNAMVNGMAATGNAVSAALTQFNFTTTITPYTTIYLWIQSQVKSNSVVSTVTSPQTQVTFGGSITEVSLAYDPTSGTFVPAPSESLPDGVTLEYHIPELL